MCGSRWCASFKSPLKVFWRTAAGSAVTLCALTAALHGCASTAVPMSAFPPAPTTPGAVVTNTEWRFLRGDGSWGSRVGEWIHLPAADAANLFLWIEQAEQR